MTPLTFAAALALGAGPGCDCPSTPPYVAEHRFRLLKGDRTFRDDEEDLALLGTVPPGGPSYLGQPAFAFDHVFRCPVREYVPQPGDIVMATGDSLFWTTMHAVTLYGPPTHSMIVFAMPDGRPAILEGGPHWADRCRLLEAIPHLASYEDVGCRVWVRRRSCPLTPCQSARLTEFCLSMNDRGFAMGRLALQLTPMRPRGPLRTAFVGRPRGPDRSAYFCSELVVEACVYAGIMDRETSRPAATFPRDLFFGGSRNLYLLRHMKAMNVTWDAPARWTGRPPTAVPLVSHDPPNQ